MDYEKLANELDPQYRQNSPWSHQAVNTPILEVPDLEKLPERPKPKGIISRITQHLKKASQSPMLTGESWRWSLFEKGALEKTLCECIRHGKKLQGFMPLMILSDHYMSQPEILTELRPHDRGINPLESHFAMSRATQASGSEAKELSKKTQDHKSPSYDLPILAARQHLQWNQQRVSPEQPTSCNLVPGYRTFTEIKFYGSLNDSNTVLVASTDGARDNEDEVHKLAALLLEAGRHHIRTLPLKGYYKGRDSRYTFLFAYPPAASECQPCTLGDLLGPSGSKKAKVSLTTRFKIATILAQAIGTFHAYGWVHKSLRSTTVRFFFDELDECILEEPYITDFALSRLESSDTRLTYDLDLEKNLYRHPERQGPPTNKFIKAHDIYALGIILLEIGVWESAKKMYRDACLVQKKEQLSPEHTRRVFLKHAQRRLDHHMGSAYRSAVEACLSEEFKGYYGNQDFPVLLQNRVVRKVDIGMLTSAAGA